VDLMRQHLRSLGAIPMVCLPHHGFVTTAGFVVSKQRPPTAKGFAFYVIEDGSLRIQLVISPDLWEKELEALRDATVLIASGQLKKQGKAWIMRAEILADANEKGTSLEVS
jgi:error-prone DNA polymerase